jgi:hypothetical protein
MSLSKVGLDPKGLAIGLDRLVELALIVERYAEAPKISSILSVLSFGPTVNSTAKSCRPV